MNIMALASMASFPLLVASSMKNKLGLIWILVMKPVNLHGV
jgi:hypothetical protein